MTYKEPLSDQVLMFVSAVGPGVIIGFLYDVIFSFFRAFGNKRIIIISADLCFSILATLFSFFYMVVYNNGIVRLNIVIAHIIGAVAFHFTLGKYISKPIKVVAEILTKIIAFTTYPAVFISKKARKILYKIYDKVRRKTELIEKNKNHKKK